jgi:hypothetical protein
MSKGFTKKKGFTLTAKDLLNFQDTVVQFNTLIGNDLDTSDEELKAKFLSTYQSLSLEEIKGDLELLESIKVGDKAGILDGICDLIYTGFAYCYISGGRCDLDRGESWLLKGDWKKGLGGDTPEQYIEHTLGELEKGDAFGFQTGLLHLLGHFYKDFDIVKGFERVTKSNFSKAIPITDIKNLDEEIKTIEDKGRYAGIGTREVNGFMVFTAMEDLQEGRKFASPKIIKASSFVDVEALGGLLEFCK